MHPDESFWRDKRVLLTGHSGFKGAWLGLWLRKLGANVNCLSLAPTTQPSLAALLGGEAWQDIQSCDIRDANTLCQRVRQARPDIVLHLAAQALVRTAYAMPVDTYATNVMGTVHLLEAVRQCPGTRVVISVTTDKVYRNLETLNPYREDDALGGHDPYSASKAACEIVIDSYRASYLGASGVALASARAGNVIGGGDWAADRIIPDAVRAWSQDFPLSIRRPQAVRPWQHVLEPLNAYLILAQSLWDRPELAGAYNFGPETSQTATVREVVLAAQRAFGRGEVQWGDGLDGPHEAGLVALDTSKARDVLGIVPRWGLQECVARTMHWYRKLSEGTSAAALCQSDIADFEAAA